GLRRYTSQVYALSPFSNARLRPTVRPSDHPPELKHVVYIIRENRTYDQVFGDVARGNGDARLAIFDHAVTPNAHAIAGRWVLFDNFYVTGEASANGHELPRVRARHPGHDARATVRRLGRELGPAGALPGPRDLVAAARPHPRPSGLTTHAAGHGSRERSRAGADRGAPFAVPGVALA